MKFELGDTVRLLHSGEEGEVVELLGRKMVEVEVDGTRFPVYNDQLEYPYYERFREMRKQKKKPKKLSGEDIPRENIRSEVHQETGVHLSVLPVYHEEEIEVVSALKLYLVNETRFLYEIQFKEFLNQCLELEINTEIRPFSRLYIKDFLFENLNDHPRFDFHLVPKNREKNMLRFFDYSLKLKAKQVIKKMTAVESGKKAIFSYILFKKYPLHSDKKTKDWNFIVPLEKEDYNYQPENAISRNVIEELDLHAEKLTDNFRNMNATDILMLQLSTLQSALHEAIANRQYSMIVIHGIGKGILKREVHAILKQTPEVKRYVNQHDFRYGFGATEVFFEY